MLSTGTVPARACPLRNSPQRDPAAELRPTGSRQPSLPDTHLQRRFVDR